MAHPLSRLDPSLLPTFLTVLGAGRISGAAKSLGLSQPAVTAQIRRLEEALGASLFIRSASGVTPTPAGERLAEYARSIQRLLDAAASELGNERALQGELAVGASTTVAGHVLPPLLAQFQARQPQVSVRVQVGNTDVVLEHVRRGSCAIGMVEGSARAPGIRLEPYLDDELVLLVGQNTHFGIRTLEDLKRVPVLRREPGSGTRAVVERALAKAGLPQGSLRRSVELGSTEALLSGVAAGMGVAFVSRWSARAHLAAGLVRIVPRLDIVIRRTFSWAFASGASHGLAASFHAFVGSCPLPSP